MSKLNPLSYGLLGMALMASALYGAVQTALDNVADKPTQTTSKAAETPVEQTQPENTQDRVVVIPADNQQQNETEQSAVETPVDTSAAEASLPAAAQAADDNGSFTPTESISEDLAVSFPVDI